MLASAWVAATFSNAIKMWLERVVALVIDLLRALSSSKKGWCRRGGDSIPLTRSHQYEIIMKCQRREAVKRPKKAAGRAEGNYYVKPQVKPCKTFARRRIKYFMPRFGQRKMQIRLYAGWMHFREMIYFFQAEIMSQRSLLFCIFRQSPWSNRATLSASWKLE